MEVSRTLARARLDEVESAVLTLILFVRSVKVQLCVDGVRLGPLLDHKKRLSTLLGRKEVALEEAINAVAIIADGSERENSKKLNDVSIGMNEALERARGEWYRVPKEELNALVEKAMQKDPMRVGALACRAQSAVDEYTSLEEKLKSTSNPTKKKQLSKLLGRKKIELDGALNEIAAIASGSEQKDSKEL
ncbi:hypothetical protein AAVH_27561 [Aphelenchoides avenae]|nr:hypothetical protein AAVH_27561 [Aphelenchus avenae]